MKQLIKISAEWCVPCKNFSPIFWEVAKEYEGKIEFLDIDVESDRGLVFNNRFNIKSLPTLLLLENGDLLKRFAGTLSKEKLREFID
jgi:thioredoxin-like negative regulator of GroEL